MTHAAQDSSSQDQRPSALCLSSGSTLSVIDFLSVLRGARPDNVHYYMNGGCWELFRILRPAGDACRNTEVVFYNSDRQTSEVLFTGKRWYARRFLRDLRNGIGWESVVAFCEKAGRNGHPGSCVEIPHGSL